MPANQPLTIAYTPDSDDAFYYDALETGRVRLPGYRLTFRRAPMSVLNRAALRGASDVTAISSVVYPHVAWRYAILSVGTSVGRGYGPVLVSRGEQTVEDLRGRRVGVPGIPTTGWFLLCYLCPEAVPVEMPFDQIAGAVAGGELEAGVMIHEELLYYPRMGLRRVVDLGAEWCRRHDLPLPVGLNVIRRDLGPAAMQRIGAAIRHSLEHALEHAGETLSRVSRFGRGSGGQCTERFVAMFANADSVQMPADVRAALHVLFCQVADLGLSPSVPPIDIIEAPAPGRAARPSRVA
jgi:1,4-dihydroxy-6-naphthoate synthase